MNDKDLEEYLIDCVLNDENGDMLVMKIQDIFKRIQRYEEYFRENSVDAIEEKLQPYYEEMARLMEEE